MSDLQVRGPLFGGTGSPSPFTAGVSGGQRVQDAHGHFFDPAYYGRMFMLASGSVTIAAANATGGALGTLAFINGFANPIGSNVIAVIHRVTHATVSGTPGGPLLYNFCVPSGRVSSAPTGTIRNCWLNSQQAGNSKMVPLVNVVLATIPADTTTVGIEIGPVGGPAAIAAGAGIYSGVDLPDGSIIVPPGTLFGLCATATGTTHIVRTLIQYEELSIMP